MRSPARALLGRSPERHRPAACGRHHRAAAVTPAGRGPAITSKEPGKDLQKHQLKLEAAVGLVQVVNGGDEAPVGAALERAKQLVPVIYERRMRGLYVDNPDGKSLYTPADITEADARELVGYLIAAVAVLSPMPSDEAPARLLMELAAEHPGSFREAAALGLELAQVASDRAAEHVRAMFRGEVPGATGEEPIAR